jgi:cytochrome P450
MRDDTTHADETPPGPSGLPIVGSQVAMLRGGLDFSMRMAREYGDVVRWEEFGGPAYQLNHPDDIERVLVENNQNYVKGDAFQRVLSPLTGNGLVNSEGETWRRNRHLVQPAFHPKRVERNAAMITDVTERLCESWSDGETRDVHDDMMALTLRIVSRALFGVDIDDRLDDIAEAVDAFFSATVSVPHVVLPEGLPLPTRRRMRAARETLDEVVDDIIRQRRHDPGEDVVSMLLTASDEGGETLSDRQIRDEAITLLVAGHETTAVALTYTVFLLAQHPEVEAKLVDELDRALGGRTPTPDALSELPYTEKVVTESMRLYPPVPTLLREAVAPDTLGGYEIPAGATIHLNQWVVHRDPRWYDDALAFRPERWTDEFERSLPRLAYFPFSAGPRRCIGDRFAMLEARLILATLYQRYHLELVSDRDVEVIPTVTARPDDDIVVVAHAR